MPPPPTALVLGLAGTALLAYVLYRTHRARRRTVDHLEVSGFHGCHHFMVACHAARVLQAKGVVRHVTVRRAGSQHVPKFSDEDRSTFNAYIARLPRTDQWDGQSPRVVLDGDAQSAMGASRLLQAFAPWFSGPHEFGLPPMRDDMWRMALADKALPIVAHACLTRSDAFFDVHPIGRPLHGAHGGLVYHDLDGGGTEYASHSLDPATDPALERIMQWCLENLGHTVPGG
jgi:hypothetical protein